MAMPPRRWDYHLLPDHFVTIRDGAAWARGRGIGVLYRRSVRLMEFSLGYDADDWGESREWFPNPDTQVRLAFINMLSVRFSVIERLRVCPGRIAGIL